MNWQDVAGKIAGAAPMIGSLLGGPLGGAAGGLVKIIASEFGLKESEVTPEKIDQIIQQDPEALLKFKEIELAHKVELQKLMLEEKRAELADRADARAMHVDTTKATGRRDINLYILAYLYTGGFFVTIIVMLWLMLTNKIPQEVPQFVVFLLGNLFGALTAGVGAVVQFFFGSSKSSQTKTELLANIQKLGSGPSK